MNLLLGGFSCKVDVLKQVTEVQNDLKFVSTDIIFENISETSLKAAAQVFFYLDHLTDCPFNEFNKWFGIWSPFYNDLFHKQSPSTIILTLNRMMKTTSNLSKNAADEIFMKISKLLSLKYENIQSSLPQKLRNSSFTGVSSILESSEGTCCILHYHYIQLIFSIYTIYHNKSPSSYCNKWKWNISISLHTFLWLWRKQRNGSQDQPVWWTSV